MLASVATAATQQQIDQLAARLQIRYELLSNQRDDQCDPTIAGGACFRAAIHLTTPTGIDSKDWSIYFSHIEPFENVNTGEFSITHINGDLHRLQPLIPITANKTYSIPLRAAFWLLSYSDIMPNWYVSAKAVEPRVITSTRPQFAPESGLEIWPFVAGLDDPKIIKRTDADRTDIVTAAQLYADNDSSAKITGPRLIPQAKSISLQSNERVALKKRGLALQHNDFQQADLIAVSSRLQQLGVASADGGIPLSITRDAQIIEREAYRLKISAKHIQIEAGHSTGAFYALQSLAALLEVKNGTVPAVLIDDAPRFAVRSLHIDVARNFHSKANLIKVIDQMAAYKLNTLHLHFADDEGWRVAIATLPELTEIGAFRCHEQDENGEIAEKNCVLPQLGSGPLRTSANNGFYSAQDYIDIVRAAAARHIAVLPSFDMPGHARAAVRSMRIRYERQRKNGVNEDKAKQFLLDDIEDRTRYTSIQYYHDNTMNVCLPSALHFVDTVVTELQRLHAAAGQPLKQFHIGADETPGAWTDSPACRSLRDKGMDHHQIGAQFIVSVINLLHKKGIKAAAWNDGVAAVDPKLVTAPVQINAWTPLFWDGHVSAQRFANLGWPVIVSSPDVLYFDFPYAAHPEERGYIWGSRFNDERKVFNFMPNNLPAHAELFRDRENNPYTANDLVRRTAQGDIEHTPLKPGVQFAGMQAHLWSETTRTDKQVEHMLFPRLLSFAERAWHAAEWELPYEHGGRIYSAQTRYFDDTRRQARARDWQQFRLVVGTRELDKLGVADIDYRVPPPGAVFRDGQLWMNNVYALRLQYCTAGQKWQNWQHPVAVSGAVEIRALDHSGKRTSRTQVVE